MGFVVFARLQPSQGLQVEIGPTILRYFWADDCSECSGALIGLRSVAVVGYRFVFAGPTVVLGWARDNRNGTEFGAVYGVQVRFVLAWGR
jgi:hypothetical protein